VVPEYLIIKRHLIMTKYCTYCSKFIDEKSPSEKWAMIITKRGEKIIEFACFHFSCYEEIIKIYEGSH